MKILIVEDAEFFAKKVAEALESEEVCIASTLEDAEKALHKTWPDVVLLDAFFLENKWARKEKFLASDFLSKMERLSESTGFSQPGVLLITGHQESAKRLAEFTDWLYYNRIHDIIHKSSIDDKWTFFVAMLRHKLEKLRAYHENGAAIDNTKVEAPRSKPKPVEKENDDSKQSGIFTDEQVLEELESKHNIITRDQRMIKIYRLILKVAPTDKDVLVLGESGTGKELMAAMLHKLSNRKPTFKAVNCSAFTETLLESELFGYVKGAFNEAYKDKKGLFEEANCGTLFLDEIGDMSLAMQTKLLRAIQEKKIRRVGGTEEIPVDVRIIAATNRDLDSLREAGLINEAFYYRIKGFFPIQLPPLRGRTSDFEILIGGFLKEFNTDHKKDVSLSEDVFENLNQYPWHGNVRELRNVIGNIVIASEGLVGQKEWKELIELGLLPVVRPVKEVDPPELDFTNPFTLFKQLQSAPLKEQRKRLADKQEKEMLDLLRQKVFNETGRQRLQLLEDGLISRGYRGSAQIRHYKALLYLAMQPESTGNMSGVQYILGLVWDASDTVLVNLCKQGDGKKTSIMNDHPLVVKIKSTPTTYKLEEHLLSDDFLQLRNSYSIVKHS